MCVFTEPEGKVGGVTPEAGPGGLWTIQVFLQTNQKEFGPELGCAVLLFCLFLVFYLCPTSSQMSDSVAMFL